MLPCHSNSTFRIRGSRDAGGHEYDVSGIFATDPGDAPGPGKFTSWIAKCVCAFANTMAARGPLMRYVICFQPQCEAYRPNRCSCTSEMQSHSASASSLAPPDKRPRMFKRRYRPWDCPSKATVTICSSGTFLSYLNLHLPVLDSLTLLHHCGTCCNKIVEDLLLARHNLPSIAVLL